MAEGTAHCYIPILGKRIRVTALDDCGAVPEPAATGAFIVTDGFITVTLTADIDSGTEIITKKADGSLCVNEKLADSFKRFTVEIEFCGVNPELLAMTTSAKVYADYAGDSAGFTQGEGAIKKKFALELWTGLQGQDCVDGGEASGYLLLPYVNAGNLDAIPVGGDKEVTFSLKGSYTMGGNSWGVGPYLVVNDGTTSPGSPAALPTALDPFDHLLLIDTAVAPPPSACDLQDMPAAT